MSMAGKVIRAGAPRCHFRDPGRFGAMMFNPISAWLEMKSQLPELAIEGIGITYVYPIFLVFLLMEFFNARHLYNLRETWASFVILVGATVIRVITNVFEITVYFFLFWKRL